MNDLRIALIVPARLNPGNLRIRMMGTWEQPWLCLSDICAVLGITNSWNVAARVANGDKHTLRWVEGDRVTHSLTFVSEAAFYRIVLRSDKTAAEPLADWVTKEVLPAIRKHGCYPPPTVKKPTLLPYTHHILEATGVETAVPAGHWCVFVEAASLLVRAEQVMAPAGLTLDPDDLLDGSVGVRWGNYRKGKPWAGAKARYDYQFPPPSRRSQITVHPIAYPVAELLHFREWLKAEYIPVYFAEYLRRKFGERGLRDALPHIRRVIPAALPRRSSCATA